ncbi:unnamed protein product [Didymodactylos carnosus]|uniref:B30.2/SPRY domain-containing protein n=1 Tax=Didymodactylos carnosus TaxID=1234261 RepID=A0A815DL61_9BILA|nr:unnamed protein product [Didymodactylos carnosus]CAF4115851.1 unnamed protein product [Didymodactylos carnosus]
MSSQKPCANSKCEKGIGILACQGCQRVFCKRHTTEHHEELSMELEKIIYEHNSIRNRLQQNDTLEILTHPLLKQIDEWESKSLKLVQTAAEEARNKIQQILIENKSDLIKDFRILTQELAIRRATEDYVETDFDRWKAELIRIKEEIKMPKHLKIDKDFISSGDMIKITSQVLKSSQRSAEKFDQVCGYIQVEDNRRLAVHYGLNARDASVYGKRLYSNGSHNIRLKIETMQDNYWLFLGIISASSSLRENVYTTKSAYGWGGTNESSKFVYLEGIENNGTQYGYDGDIRKNDILEIVLNCDQQTIDLFNIRTNKKYEITVDIHRCPFPWKLAISLYYSGDSVRLI